MSSGRLFDALQPISDSSKVAGIKEEAYQYCDEPYKVAGELWQRYETLFTQPFFETVYFFPADERFPVIFGG